MAFRGAAVSGFDQVEAVSFVNCDVPVEGYFEKGIGDETLSASLSRGLSHAMIAPLISATLAAIRLR
jgi:hypothetical protein